MHNRVPSATAETTARVETLVREWLRADEASEAALRIAVRAMGDAHAGLRMIGGEHNVDGVRYRAVPGSLTIERRIVGGRRT